MSRSSKHSEYTEISVSKDGASVKGTRMYRVNKESIIHRNLLGRPTSIINDTEECLTIIRLDKDGLMSGGTIYDKKMKVLTKLIEDLGDENGQ